MFGELQNHQRMIIRIYASTGLKVQLCLEGRASRVLRFERQACVIHAVGRRRVISPHKIADYIYSHFAAVLRSEMEPKWFSRRESATRASPPADSPRPRFALAASRIRDEARYIDHIAIYIHHIARTRRGRPAAASESR